MKLRTAKIQMASIAFVALAIVVGPARAQQPAVEGEAQQGHDLALMICSNCHVVSSEPLFQPLLRPPAPSFDSLAQRPGISVDSVRNFLATTHRDINNPQGMPNPLLIDSHARQVAAYLLSLRKLPK